MIQGNLKNFRGRARRLARMATNSGVGDSNQGADMEIDTEAGDEPGNEDEDNATPPPPSPSPSDSESSDEEDDD